VVGLSNGLVVVVVDQTITVIEGVPRSADEPVESFEPPNTFERGRQ
jgi:hypothetical protein